MAKEIKNITIYQCEKCHRYYWNRESADKCCQTRRCEKCNKELHNYSGLCESCRDKQVYDKAKKMTYEDYIKTNPSHMLYYNEKYYEDLESLLDDYCDEPAFCYGTIKDKITIDIDWAIESAEEDMDDSYFDENGLKELRSYMKNWNEKYGYNSFWKDENTIIIIKNEAGEML